MKEIGGYFGFEDLINNEYHKGLIRLNTARNALLYLIKLKSISKIYIPYYLCDSISEMLLKNKCDFEYYNVDSEFLPVFSENLNEHEYLYVVNYYGQVTKEDILELNQKFYRIIIDNTHAFFQEPLKDVDTIYSCRKFFGVPDGAYLSTNGELNEVIELDVSKDRMKHILGRYEGLASEYYNEFQQTDEGFIIEPLKKMSKLTENILGAIDYENVIKKRNKNFGFLDRHLGLKNKFKIQIPDGAFAYPYLVENGIGIRKELAKKKIYIPTLWPNVIQETLEGSVENLYASNILPLPCDQRYKEQDMQYLLEELNKCIN